MQLRYPMVSDVNELAPYEIPYKDRAVSHYDEKILHSPYIQRTTSLQTAVKPQTAPAKKKISGGQIAALAVGAFLLLGGN